jgi:hypothetical protein
MDPVVLDYRLPQTGLHRIRKIANALETEQVLEWGVVAFRLLIGIPWCFVVPLIIAGIFGRSAESTTVFFLAAAIIVPFLFWLTRPPNTDFVWEEVQSAAFARPFNIRRRLSINPLTIDPAGFVLLLLMGPRLIWSALEELRRPATVTLEQRLVCARIAAQLMDANGSQPICMLWPIDPDRKVIAQALRYLENRGWLFVSAGRDRVSLAASIRKELADLA